MGALFARIDAGEVGLTGDGGFIPGLIKATLGERVPHHGAPLAAVAQRARSSMTRADEKLATANVERQ
ncbi:hypothetical protein GCM10009573_37840 [Agromyces bracchium]